ncbi:MAG: FAD-dependent pyridine nucleotide-disulfide oxidoreductase [Verrucomicrobiaceae bacterium]|nr:FAD-dependent pyridine nucleotide-disulfide oxidoreductase [Verrucomicrobiaceae bacterium]
MGAPPGSPLPCCLAAAFATLWFATRETPRNSGAVQFNGYLTRDASSPSEFLRLGREELKRYSTVVFKQGRVICAERRDKSFRVWTDSGETFTARLLLLATGLQDQLPDIPGFQEGYGKFVHSCPYCDGWECRDQPLAVVGRDQPAIDLAIELLQWSSKISLCTNGPVEWDGGKQRRDLTRLGIPLDERFIDGLESEGEVLRGLRFSDGSLMDLHAVFLSPVQTQCSSLAISLGCETCEEDGCLRCDEDASTTVPGLYVAGNTRQGPQLVIVAVSQGTLAALTMNNALICADTGTDD